MELTKKEIENNLVFLERSRLTGKEAEVLVGLRYKLIEMRNDLIRKAGEASHVLPSDPKGEN